MVNVALVAPGMGAPANHHWYEKAPPETATSKRAGVNSTTVRSAGGVVITGYVLDNDASTAAPNPYGIPYVIGAKKGIPNFNEFLLKTMVQAVRKVEVRKLAPNQPPHLTNELFFLALARPNRRD